MTFEELLIKIQKIKCEESRMRTADYAEIVFPKTELESLTSILKDYFNDPIKCAGDDPSEEAAYYSKPYGGIRGNQTMYFTRSLKRIEMVLLWPWGDGVTITAKIIRQSAG